MQSIYNFIVSPYAKRTTSEKEVNGVTLLLNTELQNHLYTSRHGVVQAVPKVNDLGLLPGDEIIVHHNVFRRFRDIRGVEKNSRSYYEEDKFFVYPDQIYAYKRNDEWKPIEGFIFVKPMLEDRMFSEHNERPLIGKVKYAYGDYKAEELVGFTPGTEYEFNIEGEKVYRVPANRITIKYGYQEGKEEYNPSWSQSS